MTILLKRLAAALSLALLLAGPVLADSSISSLPAGDTTHSAVVPMVQSGSTKKASVTANALALIAAADYAAMRTLLDLEAGTDFYSKSAADAAFQPLDADLTSWAAITRGSGFDTFAATTSCANLRSLLTDEVGTGACYFVGGALGTPASGNGSNLTALNATELTSGTVPAARLPASAASALGGVNSKTCPAGDFVSDISTAGAITCSTPAGGGGGSGDFSSNTATSVDGEIVLFSGTAGKTGKRATGSGIAKVTSGVLGVAAAGTDYYAPGGTDVAVADGGTGASTASGARTNLGLGTSATVDTGTSGTKVPLLDGGNTWSGVQSFNDGNLVLKGATSGTTTLKAAATAGTTAITFPAGTTDFSATGGTSRVLKQVTTGAAITVAQLACADLSDAGAGCSGAGGGSGTTVTVGSDTAYTSTATLADVSGMSVAVAANTRYRIQCWLRFTVPGSNGGAKIGFTAPASYSFFEGRLVTVADTAPATTALAILSDGMMYVTSGVPTANIPTATLTTTKPGLFYVDLVFLNGANSGNLKLQAAQATSNGTATTLKADSFMTVTAM